MANLSLSERVRGVWWLLTGQEAKAAPYLYNRVWAGMPQYSKHNYATFVREGYAKNALVYACVREIAQSAAEPHWVVRRGEDVVPDHPLQKVLGSPNQYFSGFELWELVLTYLNIDGNAYLLKERNRSGRVIALWPMRPDLVHPVAGKDGGLLGYSYRGSNARTAWLPEDIIHFKYPNPGDELEGIGLGLSPLAVAAREADIDNAATDFLRSFFQNAAVPFGLLKSKQQLVDSEVRRIRARLKEQYAGSSRWHEIMVLDADAEYQSLGLNMRDMAFPDLRAISESRICMVFGVPPIVIGAKVGLDRSTFSNYGEARKSFWQETLSPMYRRIEDKLNASLVPEFGDRQLAVVVDLSSVAALQEGRAAKFERASQAVTAGWATVNDARREVGWDALPGQDVFLRPMMMVPVSAAGTETRKVLPRVKAAMGDGVPVVYERLFQGTASRWETAFQDMAEKWLRDEEAALLTRLESRKALVDYHALATDIEEVLRGREEGWRTGFIPLFEGLIGDQAGVVSATFGIDFSLQNPDVLAFIRDYSFQFAARVSETSVVEVRKLVMDAQESGDGVLALMDRIKGLYDGWGLWRAEMIARSEVIRSSNAGALASYRAAGVMQQQWWTAEDERVCPFCGAMHKKITGVDDVWWPKGSTMEVELDDDAARDHVLEMKVLPTGVWTWMGMRLVVKRAASLVFGYEDVRHPPLHPLCRCMVLPVV